VVIGIDSTGVCKSNNHAITTTTKNGNMCDLIGGNIVESGVKHYKPTI
jgi:hypothetical protein